MEDETNLSADEIHALEQAEEAALLGEDGLQDEPQVAQVDAIPDDDTPKKPEPAQDAATKKDVPAEPADKKPRGEKSAALRAARHGERQARQQVDRLNAELEALRAKVPAEPTDELTEEDLADLAADFPSVAKAARAMQKVAASVKAQPQAAPPAAAQTEFEPVRLSDSAQAVVDEIPDLSEWHNDPDQTNFQMAQAEDRKLRIHLKWSLVSEDKRLAEVARRVRKDLSDEPQQAAAPTDTRPRVNVKDAIANAPRVKPNTLADIGGGGDTPTAASNLGRYSQMSDEDIEADLLRG